MSVVSLPDPARRALLGALLGLFAAAPLAWYLRGFTVDDALIPARYAQHLARGLGYRFNPHGPSSDGVTPLGFAHLLAPFAAQGVLPAWQASRWLGRALWLSAAAALGAAASTPCRPAVVGTPCQQPVAFNDAGQRLGPCVHPPAARPTLCAAQLSLLLVLCSAPLAAWASSGLETPWVVALATAAVLTPPRADRALRGALWAGACAWLRPEMLVFALVLAVGRARSARGRARALGCVALGVAPWLLVAAVRWITWGRPAPLAVLAKPSDLAHGLVYVLPALLFTGAPFAALAPGSWRALSPWARSLVIAGFSHLAVVALAGGDWMPLARLVCPVLPAFVLATAELLADNRARRWAMTRLALACAAELAVLAMRGEAARHVAEDRLALIASARPWLRDAAVVAAVDVGWVGAASDADIVDLAGATDAEIAALPGGHTSKAVGVAFLTGRHPDVLIFQLAAPAAQALTSADDHVEAGFAPFARVVEERLGHDARILRAYRPAWKSPPELPIAYVGLRRVLD